MKKAHMLIDNKHIACSTGAYKKGQNISWDISSPQLPICKTCFNYYSKSGDYFMSCIDHPWLVNIVSIEMSKVNMMSV